MQFLNVILCSVGSIVVLFFLTKLIGNKQISNMNMFDYINGITIGSIAAEMSTALEDDFLLPLIAMIVYTLAVIFIAYLSKKSVKLGRFLNGKAILLMDHGKMYRKNFSRAQLEIGEFLTQCRINGYFNIDDIETAILEQNGEVSILPKVDARPVEMRDMKLCAEQERLTFTVIYDGTVMEQNLQHAGKNHEWLLKELKNQGVKHPDDVYLATCDDNGKLSVYIKLEDEPKNDFSQ